MPLHQPYILPELLNLLSARQNVAGTAGLLPHVGLTRLRQVISLAKEGMREYNERLNALEKQVGRRSRNAGNDDLYDEIHGLGERDEEETSGGRNSHLEEACEDAEPTRLTQKQIHHIFEKLAIHRRSLNRRGYPYTADVNEEQEKVYPGSQNLTRGDVEESWDDWRNDDGKSLFRRHRVDSEIGENSREWGERDRDRSDRRESESDKRRLRPPSREQFEAIFRRLRRDGAKLNRCGYPYTADVHDEQREMFEHTDPATSAEIERAFDCWDGRWASGRDGVGSEESEVHHGEEKRPWRRQSVEDDAREPHPYAAADWTFRIFDDILLSGEHCRSDFTTENLPRLTAVNRRLAERGQPKLENDDALQREWKEYLVVAARAREKQLPNHGPHREAHEQREACEHPESREFQDEAPVEVDLDSPLFERRPIGENGSPCRRTGERRKRKPE